MHDANGTPLKVGDKVIIPAVVSELLTNREHYCNVSIEMTLGRRPDGQKERFGAMMNAGQLVKVNNVENASLGL
jgi:hypothetical protein